MMIEFMKHKLLPDLGPLVFIRKHLSFIYSYTENFKKINIKEKISILLVIWMNCVNR